MFRQVFVKLDYACLDDVQSVETIVDCGANVGYSAAYFLSQFPSSRLVAIEPDPNNFGILSHNLKPYGLRATTIRSAVWSEPASLVMESKPYRDGRDWSRQVRLCGPCEPPAFHAIDIAGAMKLIGAQRISILKVDIEGAEGAVFRKGFETWLDLVDNIVIELHDDSVFGNCTEIFYSAIAGRGFEVALHGDLTVCKRGGAGACPVQSGVDRASGSYPVLRRRKGPRRAAHACPPCVSVVIPYHDDGEVIIDAVASVETCPRPYEIIVVNDGSKQALSLRVLDFLRQRNVTVIDQHCRGLPAARNMGFVHSRAEVVVPLDADNRLRPGFMGPALAVFKARSDVAVVYGDRCEFGLRTGTIAVSEFELFNMIQGNYIDACAAIRRSAWEDCGGYDEQMLDGWEDWDLWLRVAVRNWVFVHLAMPAFDYCVRSDSMSTRIMQPEVGRRLLGYLVRKHEELYRRFLPQLLERVQDANRVLAAAASPSTLVAADAESQRASRVAELEALCRRAEQHMQACATDAASREAQAHDLLRENSMLREEMARWERRVEAMESTRVWGLRLALLRWRAQLRHVLGSRGWRGGHATPTGTDQ